MTSYAYIALEPSGRKRTGVVDAPDRDAAIATITADGKFVVEIKEQAAGVAAKREGSATSGTEQKRKGKVSRSDLALFTRRLADLADAGLPLDRALQVVSEQSESQILSEVAESALADVRSGLPVSQSLAKYPKFFPGVYTETLKAGEASGQFPQVATRLADFQEKEVARRSVIVSALIYPAILAFFAVFVVIFLLTFVVPRLSGVFEDLGSDLPAATQALLAISAFLTKSGLYLIGGAIAGFLLYRAWAATEQGGYTRDAVLLRLPLAGPIVAKSVVSRFARVLSTLVYGGVPILEALRLSGMAAGNRVFGVSSTKVEEEVREGKPIAEAMRNTGAFPPVLTHMVAIGEETGDLPKMLTRVADSLDFEVDNGMRRLTAMVEPIIILVMGVVVGFVVLAVLLPIYQAQDVVK
ncbi:MAG: type II secretion system F family protein [Fimbriimonadaceae bacterium]